MRFIRFPRLIIAALILSPFVAQGTSSTSAPQLPDARLISQIEVTLTPDRISTPRPMLENDMSKWGCTFTSLADSNDIQSALSILKSNLTTSSVKSNSFQLRNKIVIRLKDGRETKILLSDAYNPKDAVLGTFKDESGKTTIAVISKGKLLRDLEIWTRDIEDRRSDANTCPQH